MEQHRPDFYQLLGIHPGADREAIDQAYLALKVRSDLPPDVAAQLERAYVTLTNPALRRTYDAARAPAGRPAEETRAAPRSRSRRSLLLLAGLALVLLVAVRVMVWPHVAWRVLSHPAGTRLVHRATGAPFGIVLETDPSHRFPGGASAPAYRVRLAGEDADRWLAKYEVHQLSREAP